MTTFGPVSGGHRDGPKEPEATSLGRGEVEGRSALFHRGGPDFRVGIGSS
jgi:hypothetical protein